MKSKEYTHYTKKTFEEMDENAKSLTALRAAQESERLMGMRPDRPRAEYCLLLAKCLEDDAKRFLKSLVNTNEKGEADGYEI